MTRTLKVAHVATVDSTLRFLLMGQLRRLVDEGYEVATISAPGPWVAELQATGIRHIAWQHATRAWDVRSDLLAFAELVGILRRERFDILHTHNPKPGFFGRVAGRLAGVPIVVNTVHGLYATQEDSLRKRMAVYCLEAIAARFSDAELVQSSEDFALLTHKRITRPTFTRLLGNGIDLSRFDRGRFPEWHRKSIRATMGVGDSQVVVGMVGRLVAEKGYPELFEAAGLLDERFVIWALGHADPEKRDALSPEALRHAEGMGVRFLGMRPDIDALYSAMDILVLPSHREGLPRAAMEASAMGLPVVATDIRGCREIVEHRVNGFLVPLKDIAGLARAIRTLGDDAELRAAMGREGTRRARQRFDERDVANIVMDTYRQVAARKGIRLKPIPSLLLVPDDENPSGPKGRLLARMVKRLLDVSLPALILVLLSPVLALIAIVVQLRLGKPVLFAQQRGGLNGRIFTLYKFRTMRDLKDASGNLLPDEERMTRLGSFLRKVSLDELPELFNVLKGDMSLVGPRPLRTEYLPRYTPEQARRHELKPGITGWALVNGRNALSWEQKFELDVWYVDHWSLMLDLKILIRTIVSVLRRQGISHEGHATMPPFAALETTPVAREGTHVGNISVESLHSSGER